MLRHDQRLRLRLQRRVCRPAAAAATARTGRPRGPGAAATAVSRARHREHIRCHLRHCQAVPLARRLVRTADATAAGVLHQERAMPLLPRQASGPGYRCCLALRPGADRRCGHRMVRQHAGFRHLRPDCRQPARDHKTRPALPLLRAQLAAAAAARPGPGPLAGEERAGRRRPGAVLLLCLVNAHISSSHGRDAPQELLCAVQRQACQAQGNAPRHVRRYCELCGR
mmetsp:Transcript_86387/g.222500  ORF Transcript_86387/g.222500 Transcript_86387/m.222500 type:complete len:226 (-) Transcript_86387:110-787(-)